MAEVVYALACVLLPEELSGFSAAAQDVVHDGPLGVIGDLGFFIIQYIDAGGCFLYIRKFRGERLCILSGCSAHQHFDERFIYLPADTHSPRAVYIYSRALIRNTRQKVMYTRIV